MEGGLFNPSLLCNLFFVMVFPTVFLWNCRGAGSKCFVRHLLQFVRQYKPTMLILVETRVSSVYVDYILSKTSYTNYSVFEACDFEGGI